MTKIEEVIHETKKAMPHLKFVAWDLTPFMGIFHYWRHNIIFVECEMLAVHELAGRLSEKFGAEGVHFYLGKRKPKMATALRMKESGSSIVILGRWDFSETSEDPRGFLTPTPEKMITDLILFSLRETLPINLKDSLQVLIHYLRKGEVDIPKLNRYATRRYMGWFMNIVLYKLSIKENLKIDVRHIKSGKRYLEAINEVDSLE
jgi:hypothetical protein